MSDYYNYFVIGFVVFNALMIACVSVSNVVTFALDRREK